MKHADMVVQCEAGDEQRSSLFQTRIIGKKYEKNLSSTLPTTVREGGNSKIKTKGRRNGSSDMKATIQKTK